MFSFVEPEDAVDEHERLLAIEEEILQALEIPYRVVNIAVDDLGASAAKKYDCEAWMPGQERYRELTSTSNTTDFQARRLDIRYRPERGRAAPRGTLNGTAVDVGGTLIALLENGQREDGSVAVPEVLHAWGAPAELRVGAARMTETPITPDDPDDPRRAARPRTTATPEVDDQPLGAAGRPARGGRAAAGLPE